MGIEVYFGLRAEGRDEESRVAYRNEIQQLLAGLEVKRCRAAEIESVIRAITDRSEAAANEHAAKCEPLQAELSALDAQHIQAIREKEPLPAAMTERRVQILQAISDANTALELQVEANRKTERKLRGELQAIRLETAAQGPLETALRNLASRETQRKIALNGAMIEALRRQVLQIEATQRNIQANIEICRANKDPAGERLRLAQIEDGNATIDGLRVELHRLNTEAAALQVAALEE